MVSKDPHPLSDDHGKEPASRNTLIDAFKYAARGFAYTVKTQRNMRVHVIFAIVAILSGFLLSIPQDSWFAVLICIGLVFTAECVNTALESLVDLVSPTYAELAKHAKDCAAAGVMICAAVSLLVGILVYGGAVANAMVSGLAPL